MLAGDQSHVGSPLEALGAAVPQALKAILVGVLVGAGLALASNRADGHNLMTDQSRRLILVAAPLLAFSISVGIDGNGIVSAFVCGIAYNYLRRSQSIAHELELVDDVGLLLAVVMWFVFGATAVLALSAGVTVGVVVFCLLALTVVRIVPVLLALIGSQFSPPERLMLGWLGPRGTSSIVFGLLAFNILPGEAEHAALITMVVVVLGSVVLHGAGAPAAARAFARSQATKLSS